VTSPSLPWLRRPSGLAQPGGGRRGSLRLARWAVSAQFLVMGMIGGTWMARVPAASSAWARSARPGSGLAKVVGFGYAGMTAGPAVIGALASRIGLHAALTVPAVLALWIAVAAPALTPPGGLELAKEAEHGTVTHE